MSAINNNTLTSGFAQPPGLPAFSGTNTPFMPQANAQPGPADNIQYAAPYQQASSQAFGPDAEDGYAPVSGGSGSTYNQLLNALSNLFANFGSMFGYASNPGTPVPGQPAPRSGGQGQAFFTSATANSVGDPHETFEGTTASGASLDEKWNSMKSHPNLLDSNSFAGGYRVSTAVTQPNSSGITQNQSATVTSSGGATTVAMNADGSYAVTSNGQNLVLPTGQPQNLGNGETVTLNADKSLTIVDQNGQGGCITTTLKANGTGGVDVTNDAKNVDLGGSLFGHAEYLAGGSAVGGNPQTTPYAGIATAPAASIGFDPFVQPLPQQPAFANPIENDGDLALT